MVSPSGAKVLFFRGLHVLHSRVCAVRKHGLSRVDLLAFGIIPPLRGTRSSQSVGAQSLLRWQSIISQSEPTLLPESSDVDKLAASRFGDGQKDQMENIKCHAVPTQR